MKTVLVSAAALIDPDGREDEIINYILYATYEYTEKEEISFFMVGRDDHRERVQRRFDAGIQLDGPQINVLVELKSQLQQQALFQNARRYIGVADGAVCTSTVSNPNASRIFGTSPSSN